MAYIESFEISGLAGRGEPVRFSLNRDLNVFFGLNGSGKTSLLKLLHSALSGKTTVLKGVPFSRALVRISAPRRSVVRQIEPPKESPWQGLTASKSLLHVSTILGHSAKWEWTSDSPEGVPRSGGWVHSYLPTTRLYGLRDASMARLLEESDEYELDSRFAAQFEKLWSRYNAEISRAVRGAQEQGLTALASEIINPASSPAEPLPFDDVFALTTSFLSRQGNKVALGTPDDFQRRYREDVQLRNVVNHLSQVELRVRAAVSPRTKLEALLNRFFTNKSVSVSEDGFAVRSGGTNIPTAGLSSGEKHALRLFVEAMSGHANPIIIDEPELSLHIDWQRELVSALRELKPDCQLILATHSPEVMVGVDDSRIFRV